MGAMANIAPPPLGAVRCRTCRASGAARLCDQLNDGSPGVFPGDLADIHRPGQGRAVSAAVPADGGKASLLYEGILKRVVGSDEVQGVAIACGGAFQQRGDPTAAGRHE